MLRSGRMWEDCLHSYLYRVVRKKNREKKKKKMAAERWTAVVATHSENVLMKMSAKTTGWI